MRPSVMRAAVTSGFGGIDRLEVRDDVPLPRPAAGEVLVEVGACCCNNSDIWRGEGAYGREDDPQAQAGWLRGGEPPRFPLIQGADIVGRVVELGVEVQPCWLGRRVLVDHTLHDTRSAEPYGIAGIFGSERDGGVAQYATAPATSLGVITADELSDVQVAALGAASFVTAIRMLKRARLAAGELVLVAGASGGVGTAVVVDVVGGPLFSTFLAVLRPLGRHVTVGAVAAPLVELDLRPLYLKHLDLLGSTLGTVEDFHELVALINERRLEPVVAETFALEDIHAAQAAFRHKQAAGNFVIRVAQGAGTSPAHPV